jgi:hypothetical protein
MADRELIAAILTSGMLPTGAGNLTVSRTVRGIGRPRQSSPASETGACQSLG